MTRAAGIPPEAPPLSVAQEAIYYQCLLAPEARSYNETISIRKDGEFDVPAFGRAFNEIRRRHAAWRTTFEVAGGRPVQVVAPPADLELPLLDLSGLGTDAEAQAVRLVAEASRVPYDLRRGPLLRPRLIRLAPDHHRLYLAMHHLIFDGVAVYRVVLPELVALYDAYRAGRPSPLPEPTTTYADYARYEQEWMEGPRAARRLEHWRGHLAGVQDLVLPTDRRRPAIARHRGAVAALVVERERVAELRAIGQGLGATLFQVLAASWAVVLSRISGHDDVAFSTAADLRQRPEFEGVVGCSLTPLVLRVDTSGDPSFGELVVRTRNELLDGLEHLVPFERIVRDLAPKSAPGANPIYQSMLVLEPPVLAPDPAWSIHQMEAEIGDAVGATKLDLELGLDERPDGTIDGRLVYDTDLFDEATIDRLAARWLGVIDRVAEEPGAPLSSLIVPGPADRRAMAAWNATQTSATGSVVDVVAARIAASPDAPAIVCGDEELTYLELGRRAEAVSLRLAGAGIGPGDVVALCAPPSAELVASALGVMQAGAAYLLLDPDRPLEELERAVAETGAALVYAEPGLAAHLTGKTAPIENGGAGPSAGTARDLQSDAPVCCVQVDPLGAPPIGHRAPAVLALCLGLGAAVGLGEADTVLVLAETLFCAPALELWLPLCAGARVLFAPGAAAADGAALRALAHKERVSFLHASAEQWRALIDSGLRPIRGLGALCPGPLEGDLADAISARVRVLFTGLAARETAGYAAFGPLEPGAPVTLGRPAPNTALFVLDRLGCSMPADVVGRLVVAGPAVGVPLGTGSPAANLVPDPGGEGRAFDLGLSARWRADGTIEVLGPHS